MYLNPYLPAPDTSGISAAEERFKHSLNILWQPLSPTDVRLFRIGAAVRPVPKKAQFKPLEPIYPPIETSTETRLEQFWNVYARP